MGLLLGMSYGGVSFRMQPQQGIVEPGVLLVRHKPVRSVLRLLLQRVEVRLPKLRCRACGLVSAAHLPRK